MTNVIRTLVGGRINQFPGIDTNISAPLLHYGVVIDIIYDVKSLTEEKKNELKSLVDNPFAVDIMPANSVVAVITSNQQNLTNGAPTIVFPFFQSHIMLPIQVGEQIIVIYDDYSYQGAQLGRWITRNLESFQIEDLNYTHGDRRYDPHNNPAQENVAELRNRIRNRTQNPRPSFPNGGGTPESFTLPPSKEEPGINPYDKIVFGTNAGKLHSFEVVSRWTKRPQELVLQGMNNTIIVLGQDRIGPANRDENNQIERRNYSGTIDIVAGRGRVILRPDENNFTAEKETSAPVVQNTRNFFEVDKTPNLRNRRANPKEGDPNFKNDAARIYVSMNTAGDTNFNLVHNQNGTSYPDNTLRIETQREQISDTIGNSYVIQKADHIRVIARKSQELNINGDVLIIKEGSKDEDLGFFYIKETGELQLEGKKIYLGKAVIDNESAYQPYIKFQEYKKTIKHLQEQIDILKSHIQEISQILFTAFNGAVAVPASPIASLTAAARIIQDIANEKIPLINNLSSQTENKINLCKSNKIFGE
jgi:hypothetical protein